MNFDDILETGLNVSAAYGTLYTSLATAVITAIQTSDVTATNVRMHLRRQMEGMGYNFVNAASRQILIHAAMDESDPQLTPAQHEHVTKYIAHALASLAEDIALVSATEQNDAMRQVKKAAMSIELDVLANGTPRSRAVVAHRFNSGIDQSTTVPPTGRVYRVRMMVQQHLNLLRGDLEFFALVMKGFRNFVIVGQTSQSGVTFDMTQYDLLREDIFHPNTQASIEGVPA